MMVHANLDCTDPQCSPNGRPEHWQKEGQVEMTREELAFELEKAEEDGFNDGYDGNRQEAVAPGWFPAEHRAAWAAAYDGGYVDGQGAYRRQVD